MKHLILIDPLDKLDIKKDSSLLLALTLKQRGDKVYLIFEDDFYWLSHGKMLFTVFDFEGVMKEDGVYLESFSLLEADETTLEKEDCFHLRLDPPFDARYLRILWLLRPLEKAGVQVINSAYGILKNNEKVLAYEKYPDSILSYVGSSYPKFKDFCGRLSEQGHENLVVKPLDLYQGLGVEKWDLSQNLEGLFKQKIQDGPVVAQAYIKEITTQGEVRAFYYAGEEVGSIIKVPESGTFLANVAQGASFEAYQLTNHEKKLCDSVAAELKQDKVPWIAFDLLGGKLSEVNITCPGLLVEVSSAHKKNLAEAIIEHF